MKSKLIPARSHLLLLQLALAGLASAPVAQAALSDPARTIVRMADANGDGTITGDEWVAFLGTLQVSAEGELEGYAFKSLMLGLDADGDGELARADVVLVLSEEAAAQRGFLAALVHLLADGDGDGRVSEGEREAFLLPLAEGSIPAEIVADWMRRAEAIPPDDVNAMTPGVILLSLEAAYDTDGSGTVTLVDLNALHRGLDGNGDGAIDPAELRAGRQGGRFGDWSISSEQRTRTPVMPWQRSLEDAQLLSERTGKPLLLCVNVDGENASENLAWGRYRDPAFAELADGFVCLLASPDRHSAFDRDDRGRRIEDPRFGRLIDPEHIDIEPTLYERWFNGRRVAPRHVGVSPEGDVLFDLFLLQDLTIVDAALRKHGVPDSTLDPEPRAIAEVLLLDSPDARHRGELERRFAVGDEDARTRLAGLALSAERAVQHPELIRMALRDPSARVRAVGLATFVAHPGVLPVDQLPAAFALARGDAARVARVLSAASAAAALSEGTPRGDTAAFHARAHSGLLATSSVIDAGRWSLALGAAPAFVADTVSGDDEQAVIALLPKLEAAVNASEAAGTGDAELWIWLAAARMRAGDVQIALGGNPSFFFQDAAVAARRALELRPTDGRALALAARSAWMSSKPDEAGDYAARALPDLVRDASSALALEALKIFANARVRGLYAAMQAGEVWDPALVPDAVAAYEVLVAHPGGGAAEWRAYLDLLGSLSAFGEQASVLRRALVADPASPELHNYLRFQVLRDGGARALEAAYDERAFATPRFEQGATWDWFHGLASLVAAERDVQTRHPEDARGAYLRCVERFDEAVASEPSFVGSAGHYQALALAGVARLDASEGRYGDAHGALLRAFALAPASLESPDGLGVTPLESAREVARVFRRSECPELADELAERLAELDLVL